MGRSRYKTNDKSNNKFKCAAYIRLSQEDGDKEESNSVTSQREIIDYFFKSEDDLEMYDYYIDDGFTGTDFKRPSFQRMIDDIEKRNINTIVVKDLSRFGRNYIEVGNFIEQVFPTYNIRFISISDKIDNYKNPSSLNSMIFPFKNMINEEYCRDISRKIKTAKMARMKKGDFMSGLAPYGYVKNPEDIYKFLIDEESSKVVKKIFDMFLSGKGYGYIVHYLNDNNIVCPSRYKNEVLNIKYRNSSCNSENIKNKKWTINAVRRTLLNQVYCGDIIQAKSKTVSHKNHNVIRNKQKDWIIVENTHDPIISKEDFNKVQEMMVNNTNTTAPKSQPNIYAGHLRCSKCGKAMIRKYTGRRRSNPEIMNYSYYCYTYARISHNECIINRVRSEDLDNIVIKAIKHQIKLYIKADKLINELSNTNTTNDTKQLVINIENELNAKRKIKQKFYEDWKLKLITQDEYMKFAKENENTINILTERLSKYSKKLEDEESIDNKKELFQRIAKYKDIKVLNKTIIDDLIDDIYANEDGSVEIVFKYQDEYQKLIKLYKRMKNVHSRNK